MLGVLTAPGLQMLLDGSVSSAVLEGLQPLTQYSVQVYSVLNQISSEPLAGTETTCELPSPDPASSSSQTPPPHSPFSIFCCPLPHPPVALPTVTDLRVFDETSTTMKVTWAEPVGGASGYTLRYRALNTVQPEPEKEVKSRAQRFPARPAGGSVVLPALQSATEGNGLA